jgi:YgiT-type zinc finger domain-containing protein
MDSRTKTEAAMDSCELCRIGHCQPITAPYIYWVDRQVLVLPNAPAFLCDICGQLWYDAHFLNMLDILLNEWEYGLSPKEPPRAPLAPQQPAGLQPTRSR